VDVLDRGLSLRTKETNETQKGGITWNKREPQKRADKPEPHCGRTPDQDLELWKHFATFGGADKNTMVTAASWILGFSATIVGFSKAKPAISSIRCWPQAVSER
jgi:hypothetical protein